MENLNGREIVESGDLCERRNGDLAFCNHSERNIILWTYRILSFVLCGRERCRSQPKLECRLGQKREGL